MNIRHSIRAAFFIAIAASGGDTERAAAILREAKMPGGVIVHVNCGDGGLTSALRAGGAFIVHGLEADAAKVEAARSRMQAAGVHGPVSAERWTAPVLPHADRLANLILVSAGELDIPEIELLRVLAPGGVVIWESGDATAPILRSIRAPWPEGMGDWTHYQFDSRNNAVGTDTLIGPPRRFQWNGEPLWSTAHESMASLSAMVSANGRLFYIIDEGPVASSVLPADWQLVARDAFNGVVLWRRPIERWLTRFWPWKSGPAQMPRKLVAAGDAVYAPLDFNGPLSQIDAATGAVRRTYPETAAAEEVVCRDGILLVMVNPSPPDLDAIDRERRSKRHFNYDGRIRVILDHGVDRRIVAVHADTGAVLWRRDGPRVLPLTLAADGQMAVYHDGTGIVGLDLRSGAERWRSGPIEAGPRMAAEDAPTLVLHEKAVLFAWNRTLTAVSTGDGRTLWTAPWTQSDYRSPVSVMILDGLAWSMDITGSKSPGDFIGRDPVTGEVRREFNLPPFSGMSHHRCHKAKATGGYVLLSRSGVEYVDVARETYEPHHWIRGACLYGILPANGLLYATPHPCACYIKAKLNGFTALAPASAPGGADVPSRVEQGPAFTSREPSSAEPAQSSDWPTYRGDGARSGAATTPAPSTLKRTWRAEPGGELTAVTVADGRVFVAQRDRNRVLALDAATGAPVWSYNAGARADSPATIADGSAIFGSADGYVYALRAADGVVRWRSRAAPADRRVASFDRIESAWPVSGSVLVDDGAVYCAAGRSSFLDGGIRLVKLDAATGAILCSAAVHDFDEAGRQPKIDAGFGMEGLLPDILSADSDRVFVRHRVFSRVDFSEQPPAPHLFSPAGFLDDTWWHRTYWVYGESTGPGYPQWWTAGNRMPAGRILVRGPDAVYGFGRSVYPGMNAAQFSRGEEYILFSAHPAAGPEPDYKNALARRKEGLDLLVDWSKIRTTEFRWTARLPFEARALALAGGTLFAAGPYGDTVRSVDAFEGREGVRLGAIDAEDGRLLENYAIDALPVFDGLAAADGSLFLAMKDGSIQRFGARGETLRAVGPEPVQRIEEQLLPSDEADANAVRELGRKKAGPAAAPRESLSGRDRSAEFDRVADGRVVDSPLGYRLGADPKKSAVALRKLDRPVTDRVEWTVALQAAPGFPHPPHYRNGYFAFGESATDADTVKCGLLFVAGSAVIVEGSAASARKAQMKIEFDADKPIELRVAVDLETQTVEMTVGGRTLKHRLQRRVNEIRYVGYAAWNAVTDFSRINP